MKTFSRSLKSRMTVTVLMGVIPPMLVAILFASIRAAAFIRQEAEQQQVLRAQVLSKSLAILDRGYEEALGKIRLIPAMASMDPQRQTPLLAYIRDAYNLDRVQTIDTNGSTVASAGTITRQNYRRFDWFQDAITGTQSSHVSIDSAGGIARFCQVLPIRRSEELPVGVLEICFSLADIERKVG